jgi:hypothetical protein
MSTRRRLSLIATAGLLLVVGVVAWDRGRQAVAREEDERRLRERRRISYAEFEAALIRDRSDVHMPPAYGGRDDVRWKDNWGCEPYRPPPVRGDDPFWKSADFAEVMKQLEERVRAEREREAK